MRICGMNYDLLTWRIHSLVFVGAVLEHYFIYTFGYFDKRKPVRNRKSIWEVFEQGHLMGTDRVIGITAIRNMLFKFI